MFYSRSSPNDLASSVLLNDLPPSGQIDSMIVFDRSVDVVTPLCTQLTYGGLLEEVYGVEHRECIEQ